MSRTQHHVENTGRQGFAPQTEAAKRSASAFTLIELLACPPKPLGRRRSRSAFTLIELLVVIAIIALLISLLAPSLSGAMGRARRVACANQLRQIGTGVYLYASENEGHLPTYRRSTSFFASYWLYFHGHWVNLGLLHSEGFIENEQTFFSPIRNAFPNDSLAYNGPGNNWPGRSSYTARFLSVPSPPATEPGTSWQLIDYNNKVIYSSFIGVENFVTAGGAATITPLDGYNRLFGDSSVRWTAPGPLTRQITHVPPPADLLVQYFKELDTL